MVITDHIDDTHVVLVSKSFNKDVLSGRFESWHDALMAMIEARQNQSPEQADPLLWKVFELYCFVLIPGVNQ